MRMGADSEPLPLGHRVPWHTLPRWKRTSSPDTNTCAFTCSKLVQGESAERPSPFRASPAQSTKYVAARDSAWTVHAARAIAGKRIQAKEKPSEPMGRNTLRGVYDICVGDHESLKLILNRMKFATKTQGRFSSR